MWSAFKAIASRIGLSAEKVEEVERDGDVALVQHPLNSEISFIVRPDPDWTARLGEAWNGVLVNSRRETAGTIRIEDGLLSIADAVTPDSALTAIVVPGHYEVTFTVAHSGADETSDYEEHVSHAFVLLEGARKVALIEPLTDEDGIELVVDAYAVAFARAGVLQEIAGNHAGRWMLRIGELMRPKSVEGDSRRNSVKVENDDKSGAAIIMYGGYRRGDYPLFRMADADGNNIGIMIDFFVDNRPF
jgi:hypothetical protein